MRRDDTLAEKIAWTLLKDRRLDGYKFRRQVPIENYIVDFYCHQAKLIIELDGDIHAETGQFEKGPEAGRETEGARLYRNAVLQ